MDNKFYQRMLGISLIVSGVLAYLFKKGDSLGLSFSQTGKTVMIVLLVIAVVFLIFSFIKVLMFRRADEESKEADIAATDASAQSKENSAPNVVDENDEKGDDKSEL